MPRIRLLDDENPVELELTDDVITIGRTPNNSIQVMDPSASKEHAQVVSDAEGWRLVDVGSRNGTFVNGERCRSYRLAGGDRIRIGQTEMIIIEGSEAKLVVEDSTPDAPSVTKSQMKSLPVFKPISLEQLAEAEARDHKKGSSKHRVDIPSKESLAERKLQLIHLIGEKLVAHTDNEKLAEEILSIVMQQTQADRGFFCLFDEAGDHIPLASRGLESGEEMRISHTVLRRLQEEQSGILVRPGASGEVDIGSLKRMNVKSTLCVPLWTSDQITGFISLDARTPDKAFTEEHLDLLMAVAHQAAIGVERGRLAKQTTQEQSVRNYLCKYLDAKIVQHILRNEEKEDPLAPKEQEVTVLFADIVSFTKMSEGMAPTELAAFVRSFLTTMTDIIFMHGGTIDKYIGDSIMALFGAPIPSDTAAQSAIRSALAMREFAEGEQGGKMRLSIGIATGRAVVGNIGSEQRTEYTAIGDTVNVASRLQAFARPNEICIGSKTYDQSEDQFAVQEIGTIDVKNRHEPVEVYKVLGEMSLAQKLKDMDTVSPDQTFDQF